MRNPGCVPDEKAGYSTAEEIPENVNLSEYLDDEKSLFEVPEKPPAEPMQEVPLMIELPKKELPRKEVQAAVANAANQVLQEDEKVVIQKCLQGILRYEQVGDEEDVLATLWEPFTRTELPSVPREIFDAAKSPGRR